MASHIDKPRGQALVELTVGVGLALFIISACISLIITLKKEIKHDFLESHHAASPLPVTQEEIPELLREKIRIFKKQKVPEIIDQLASEGWVEDRRLKVPEGLVILLSNGSRHMNLIQSKVGSLGIND